MTSNKRDTLQKAIDLLDDSDESDFDFPSSQKHLVKRERPLSISTAVQLPPKKRQTTIDASKRALASLMSEPTSYQEIDDYNSDYPDIDTSSQDERDEEQRDKDFGSINSDRAILRDAIQREKARKARFHRELVAVEQSARTEWKLGKATKQTSPVLIPLAPVINKDEVKSRSLFLITLTDNTTIIPEEDDNWYALYAGSYHDEIISRLTLWAESGFPGIIRPAGGVKDSDTGARQVEENVFNGKIPFVRERATDKGQAHIHAVFTINYYNRGGFYPHIDLAKIRSFMDGIGGKDKRIHCNVSFVKPEEYDAYRYLRVPAGEKREAKKSSYKKKNYSTTA